MALITTVSGASSDSYATLAEALSYFTTARGNPEEYEVTGDWTHADTTDPMREGCMRAATLLIDKLYNFNWTRALDTQRLKAPFDGATTDDGIDIANTVIPEDIKRAQFEIARALLVDISRLDDQEIGLSSLGVDVINLAFDKYDRPSMLPPTARLLLKDYGGAKSSGSAREVRRA